MGEITIPLVLAVWAVLGVAVAGLVVGLLPALYLLWRREGQLPPDVAAAERDVIEINRAAQRAMLFDALRRGKRPRIRFPEDPPINAEWQEDRG